MLTTEVPGPEGDRASGGAMLLVDPDADVDTDRGEVPAAARLVAHALRPVLSGGHSINIYIRDHELIQEKNHV